MSESSLSERLADLDDITLTDYPYEVTLRVGILADPDNSPEEWAENVREYVADELSNLPCIVEANVSERTEGSTWFWDDEDCPRDDCDGALEQQDRFNVMCRSCEAPFVHWKDDTGHQLVAETDDVVAEKPRTVPDGGTDTGGTERREELVYGGVCPVCGDEFTDGFDRLEDLEGESIEGVRICVIDPPEECLFHLPEDQTDRSVDTETERSGDGEIDD